MKFQVLDNDIFQRYDVDDLSSYKVLEDTENFLLFYDEKFSYGITGRNVCYKKIHDACFQRIEMILDFSKEFDFFIQTQQFEVLHENFGFVETERSIQNMIYCKELERKEDFPDSFYDLRVLVDYLRKNGNPISSTQEGYFRMGGEYGVDSVFSSDGRKSTASFSCVYLDDAIKTLQNLKKLK